MAIGRELVHAVATLDLTLPRILQRVQLRQLEDCRREVRFGAQRKPQLDTPSFRFAPFETLPVGGNRPAWWSTSVGSGLLARQLVNVTEYRQSNRHQPAEPPQ